MLELEKKERLEKLETDFESLLIQAVTEYNDCLNKQYYPLCSDWLDTLDEIETGLKEYFNTTLEITLDGKRISTVTFNFADGTKMERGF